MAGLLTQMFPEFGESLAGRSLSSAARGFQKIPSGMLDLASLPFTLTGAIKPEDAVGSSAWMEKKGMLIPEQRANNPRERAMFETMEMLPQFAVPTAIGGAMGGKAAQYVPTKQGLSAGVPGRPTAVDDVIPTTRGQQNGNVLELQQAAKLANEEAFAQRINDFAKTQNETARVVVDNFAKSVGKLDGSTDLGKRLQFNFETWFDGVKATYKTRTDAAFDVVAKHPGANQPMNLPANVGDTAYNFVNANLKKNSPDAYKAALNDLQQRTTDILAKPDLSVAELQQYLKEANSSFSQNAMKQGPYDTVNAGDLSRIQAAYKQTLQDALEHTIKNGPADVSDAAMQLKKANRLYGVTVENTKKLQGQTINRFLGAKEDEILNPESVTKYFKTLSPGQQQFFKAVSNKVDPEMVPTLRREIFNDMYKMGQTRTEGTTGASFDIKAFLAKAEDLRIRNPEMFDFVMGDPASKARFEGIIDNMKEAVTTGPAIAGSGSSKISNLAAASIGAATNQLGAARAASATFGMLESLGTDKEALFKHLFEGGPPPQGAMKVGAGKVLDVAGTGVNKATDMALGTNGKTGVGTGFRQAMNMELAEGLNRGEQQAEEIRVTASALPPEGSIDPSLLEGWEATAPEPSRPLPGPTGGIDPELLKGW